MEDFPLVHGSCCWFWLYLESISWWERWRVSIVSECQFFVMVFISSFIFISIFIFNFIFIFLDTDFMNGVFTLFSLIVLNSSYKETKSIYPYKMIAQYGQVTDISSMVWKWLNHEWMQTWDVNVVPFNETTIPHIVPEGEFILKSNYSLI